VTPDAPEPADPDHGDVLSEEEVDPSEIPLDDAEPVAPNGDKAGTAGRPSVS